MRCFTPGFLLALALLATPSLAPSAPPVGDDRPLPKVLYHPVYPSTSAPVWVEASEAILPDGRFSSRYLTLDAIESLRDLLRNQPENECAHLTEVFESKVNPPLRIDIGSASRTADLVAEATVTGRSFGFRQFRAGQLLRLRIDRVLKGELQAGEERFIFYPVATFKAGPYRICKTDRRYPTPPEIGGKVVIFIPFVKNTKAPFLELYDEASLLTIRSDKSVELPSRFISHAVEEKAIAPASEAEVLAIIIATLGEAAEP